MKKCSQCGSIKVEDEFRPYYGKGRRGRYRQCLTCESINNRYKYLNRKATRTEADEEELQAINELFDLLRSQGLQPPAKAQAHKSGVANLVQQLMEERMNVTVQDAGAAALQEWLEKDISGYEEWELQDIFDELEDEYRPKIGVDPETFKPIFDETYKDLLDQIETRFNI